MTFDLFVCRQQRVAVKMRSAEGSGLMQRRNGELKRQGRSLQDLDRVREEEKAQKEEEEEAEKNGIYDVRRKKITVFYLPLTLFNAV